MPDQDPVSAEQTAVARETTSTERKPYSAPYVKRLCVTDTESGKSPGSPVEFHITDSTSAGPS